ncbi:MAG TPA: pyridoxamine 5'-phosphate oxidase family protein [Oxalicibacterium sp.]|nr:pyridoxamine 5'-phosphate oxidase family protein [Oxalicibacterium sp.]
MNTPAIKTAPFHAGELRAQHLAGIGMPNAAIRERMPEQHRSFFPLLRYAVIAALDREGRPLASIVTGPPGFISAPSDNTLHFARDAHWLAGTQSLLRAGQPIGMLGIDLATRRRNRANGVVMRCDDGVVQVQVSQSFGNCPKYIQLREVVDASAKKPARPQAAQALAGLDARAASLISAADTFFVASGASSVPESGLDVSHKGGRPGFIRVDGDTLTIPDFTGNRYFNTLGNLLLEPRAALLFIDFLNGDVLQLQGTTEILWHAEEASRPDGAERLWRFRVERGMRIEGALPLRWEWKEWSPATERTGTWPANPGAAGVI